MAFKSGTRPEPAVVVGGAGASTAVEVVQTMEGRRHHSTGANAGNVRHDPCLGYVLPGGPFGRNVGGRGAKGGAVRALPQHQPQRGAACVHFVCR